MIGAFLIHRALVRAALSGVLLFSWVLLFAWELARVQSLPQALGETALAYALSQIAIVLGTPLAARNYERGMVRLMILSLLLLAGALVFLAQTLLGAFDAQWGIPLFALCAGLFRALYGTPFALMSPDLYSSNPLLEILLACVPAVAGLALTAYGQPTLLLYLGAGVSVLSALFLLRFEGYERFEWTYRETFGMLLEPAHRNYVAESIVRGIEGASLFLIWPLFVFIVLGMSYFGLGTVLTATALLLLALRGVPTRHVHMRSPVASAAVAGGSWIARIFAVGPLAIVAVQFLGAATDPRRAHAQVLQDHFADGGTFLDEVTVLKEVSLGLGRLIIALVFAALVATVAFSWAVGLTFATAGAAAAVSAFWRK